MFGLKGNRSWDTVVQIAPGKILLGKQSHSAIVVQLCAIGHAAWSGPWSYIETALSSRINKKLQLQGFVSKQPIALRTLEDEDNVNIDSIDSDEEDQDGHKSEEKGNVSASGDGMDSEDEKILDPMADANEDKEENENDGEEQDEDKEEDDDYVPQEAGNEARS
ncbi:hypothetical protein C8F04DRAFT_1405785 [Mycena alexandri]|uniref:Uncharacterized protein n=1 Tax=Mycena alexandri TaxID=1745969 RepID=A0AAD6WKS8_9AGAR|nr:hypothetical protein C8F04DRAFT_1405785 [Mycena alexandri]